MKKFIPFLVLALGAAWLISTLFPRQPDTAFDLSGFGRLPVLANGRIKPMDTIARSALLQLQGRQTVTKPDESKATPIEWLLSVCFDPATTDTWQTFEIVNPDVLALFDLRPEDGAGKKRFSYHQLDKNIPELLRQSKLAQAIEGKNRSPFQRAVVQLHGSLQRYQSLKHTLILPDSDDFLGELLRFQDALPSGIAAVRAKQAGQPYSEDAFQAMIEMGQRYDAMASLSNLRPIPPAADSDNDLAWNSTGQALLETFKTGSVSPTALAYAGLAHAWRQNKPAQFNKIIELYRTELDGHLAPQLYKTDIEVRFNAAQPFYWSMFLYVGAFVLAIISWLKWPDMLGRSAFWLVVLAFIATTAGIITRMWLEGRPPVTNLYSSALFVGWGSVLLCIVLESIYKNAIGSVAAGLIGLGTLVIAHHLAIGGDTLEMMRAVLDSNFWLATHVVVVTIGYAATFLAGFLALIYVVLGVFTSKLTSKPNATDATKIALVSPIAGAAAATAAHRSETMADALARMVYGIVCFATLFSFVGTVLGGIWADQSWGRFWGWDPKENGALIIVIWNAVILHARWGGLVKQRGLMALAIFGNIVTSWSWFGTNMLGIGLHSYGFMDAAFWWLLAFITSQLGLIAIANLPLAYWRSFRGRKA